MIWTHLAYSQQKNLGKAYNDFMKLLPEDDWACYLDHDAMMTTTTWYNQLESVISKHPECRCFVPMTNRIGCEWQRYGWVSEEDHDIRYHRRVGLQIQQSDYDIIEMIGHIFLLYASIYMSWDILILTNLEWEVP